MLTLPSRKVKNKNLNFNLWKKTRKIYARVFKEKAVQLSYERRNISELARELGITTPQLFNGEKSTKSLDKEDFLVTAI